MKSSRSRRSSSREKSSSSAVTPSRSAPSKSKKKRSRGSKKPSRDSSQTPKSKPSRPTRGLRYIRRGTVWLVTKKTNDDFFFLRPDGTVEWILLYLLILKVNKFGLLLHGFVVMSNHIHLVVTDVRGMLPKFMCEFLTESGKAIKDVHGGERRIWSPNRYSAVELLDRDAAERLIAYCHTNPTKAGLTLRKEWPGLTSARFEFGDTLSSSKPNLYFRPHRPEFVECTLAPLPPMEGDPSEVAAAHQAASSAELGPEEQQEALRRLCDQLASSIALRVAESVEAILKERARKGKKLAGREAVLRSSREQRGNSPTRGTRPRFASTNPERMKRAEEEYELFCLEHADAKERYIAGAEKVLFPYGTYGYREVLRVQVRAGGVAA